MCGIAGEIRFDDKFADVRTVADMTETQSRRGPDGEGIYSLGRRCFGHRRLSIMDLSQRAHQPFIDNTLGLGIVFNGAIYNYPELREELSKAGYQFASTGDTEVIIKAWHAWGPQALERLKGMFAFALWERDSGMTYLARDRLGIKPLYYTRNEQRMHFASTLPALLKGGVDTTIDPQALHHYLSFHAVVPAPHTILRGVRKLAPGTWMAVHPDGRCDEKTWWSLAFERSEEDQKRGFDEWKDMVLQSLRLAVKRRLVADVPVGVLLSGGLDSSLITGLLIEAGANDLRTYSIGFDAVDKEAGDEYFYSDLIAKHYDTVHEKIHIPAEKLLSSLPEAITAMSEPMVSHDCVAFYLLSRAVSRHSRVVQSGQGADEVFGGYHWYPPLTDVQHTADGVNAYRKVFFDQSHAEMQRLLSPDFAIDRDWSGDFIARHFQQPGAGSVIDQAMRLDTTVMLVDDPVKRVDNMTMAFGLEARVPFLDHDLVELAARIPAQHKIAEGGKYVLKEAARAVIPAAVIDRPKGYFPVPALKYLRGDFLHYIRDILDSQTARERGLFQRQEIDRMMESPDSHITPLRGSKIWQVALLEAWLQAHKL
jgi:asparagine synthase (glutamine-hydrolysing)